MQKSFIKDWKFVLMLVVTIAGVLPIWMKYFHSPDKQVVVREISQSAIQSVTKNAVPGLQIMVDGAPLSNPYFSILKISNDGDKPITVRDFESPLEIQLGKNRIVVHAVVSKKKPVDVIANITWEKNIIRLAPTLLNPKDEMTISVLSTGGAPKFAVRARIAGVKSVPVIKAGKGKPQLALSIFLLIGAFMCAVPGVAAYSRWWPSATSVQLRSRTVLAISIMLQFATVGLIMGLLSIYGIDSFWLSMLAIFSVSFIAYPFARWLESRPDNDRPG